MCGSGQYLAGPYLTLQHEFTSCAPVMLWDGWVGHCQQVFEVAEFVILNVLLEFPLELGYDVFLVLHYLELLCFSKLGHTILHCWTVLVQEPRIYAS